MDKISVIVPVYKVEQYLERCVRSICSQTYPALEIILVDDGSPDRCPALCDDYARQDARIRVLHKKNGGLSDARNAGMDIATGQYLAFVDSDDWIDPLMIEMLHTLCKKYHTDIAECSYRNVYADHIQEETTCSGKIIEATPAQAIEGNLDWKYFKPVAWNKLYRADITCGIRYPVGKLHEDEFSTHKFYLASQKIVYADVSAYNYDHSREDSITAKFTLRNLDACEAYHEKVHLICDDPNLVSIQKKICNVYGYTLFDSLNRCVENGLGGPELDQTIKNALDDMDFLVAHDVDASYQACFKTLRDHGLNACVKVWNKR